MGGVFAILLLRPTRGVAAACRAPPVMRRPPAPTRAPHCAQIRIGRGGRTRLIGRAGRGRAIACGRRIRPRGAECRPTAPEGDGRSWVLAAPAGAASVCCAGPGCRDRLMRDNICPGHGAARAISPKSAVKPRRPAPRRTRQCAGRRVLSTAVRGVRGARLPAGCGSGPRRQPLFMRPSRRLPVSDAPRRPCGTAACGRPAATQSWLRVRHTQKDHYAHTWQLPCTIWYTGVEKNIVNYWHEFPLTVS